MNKTVIWVVVLIAAAAVAAFYVWPSLNRYSIETGTDGVAFEVDGKTGKSWALRHTTKAAHKSRDIKKKPERILPNAEQAKVTGSAELSFGRFSGEVYNGSKWTITRIVFGVTATEESGSVRWARDHSENIVVGPRITRSFSGLTIEREGMKNAPYSIKEVYGYQE